MQTTLTLASNKRMTYCPVCNGNAEEVVVGDVIRYVGPNGEVFGYGHPGGVLSQELLKQGIKYVAVPLEDHEKAPGSHPCPDCAAGIAMQRKRNELEVIKGGLHWYCVQCRSHGVVVAGDSKGFSAQVRGASGVQPPNQLGVKFTNCQQHAAEDDPKTGIIH